MKKVTLITYTFLFFFFLSTNAQERTLEGTVTDKSGQPLTEVRVEAEGTDLFAITNEKGHYKIESVPQDVLTLRFSHPDMENASATVGIYTTIDVMMTQVGTENVYEISLEDLLNMEVTTASKSAEKQSDAPGAISVLTKDEINRFGGTTLKDLLERMPSLIGSTVYMTDRSTIAPRGDQVPASSSHVLLLINGRPMREVLEGGIKGEMYEAFPVNAIERIEVIRGPGSVLYGSNAFSAVINVITEEAETTGISATAQTGVEGGYGAMVNAKLNVGKLKVLAAARHFEKRTHDIDWEYDNITADTTVGISIPNVGTGAYFDASYNNLRLMASYSQWRHYYFITDYAFLFPAYGEANWSKGFIDLGYSYQATENWNMDVNMTYTRSTFDSENWPYTNRDSYELVGEWTNFINPIDKLGIVFGGLFNYLEGDEWGPVEGIEKFIFTDDNRYSIGAYAQVNFELLSNLNIIGGLQANKVQDIDLNIVPRAGLIWYPAERLNVKAFYGQAFRAPSINELTINFPDMQGNPDLTPEKVSTVDIGVSYQGEQVHTGISFFYSKQKNIIFQNRDTTVVTAPMYWNGAEVEFMGVELEGKYYVNRDLFFTGSMLYQSNEDKNGNENVTPIAQLGIKAGVSYMKKGFGISLFDIYQGDLDDTYKTQLNPSPGAYHLMHCNIKYDFRKLLNWEIEKSLILFVQVDNLLDEKIWLTDWGLTPGKSIPVNLGRDIYIGLTVTL